MTTLAVLPLQPVPAQTFVAALGGQRCRLTLYEKQRYPLGETASPALYIDVEVNDSLVLGGVLVRNGVPIIRDAYVGFIGELLVFDTQGDSEPEVAGLGARWVLGYLL